MFTGGPSFFTSGVKDPLFANVKLLLPFDSDYNDMSNNHYTGTAGGTGAIVASAAAVTTIYSSAPIFMVGAAPVNTTVCWNGLHDEIRITTGASRYNDAYTPSGPFPTS